MQLSKIITRKGVMKQSFDKEGKLIPLTVLTVFPAIVADVLPDNRVRLISTDREKKNITKPLKGILKKAGVKKNFSAVFEAKILDGEAKRGDEIKLIEVLKPGDRVKATGVSKGRGFSGVIKRWGFHSQPKTRGQSDRERATGSIGAQTPGRVLKGKKMPGHYGNTRITVDNLEVVHVDPLNNEIWVKGAVPGHIFNVVYLSKIGSSKKFIGLNLEEKDDKEQEKIAKEKKTRKVEEVSNKKKTVKK
jgi:large subunit ribosomal protein L3